ncbi:MAG: MerR family transcriptional regulator [Sporichthyaceae bacterium]|nr:MerR family transcriptional regulator [Sporichthyaceae bacterium]
MTADATTAVTADATADASIRPVSIGEVLTELRQEFPDVSISKIRFLEAEGLVQPERSPSGYRMFGPRDIERLRYVLAMQRDHYLPLRVIKEHLQAIDRGLEPPRLDRATPQVPSAAQTDTAVWPGPDAFRLAEPDDLLLSRTELLAEAGLDEASLAELEEFGLLTSRNGGYFDRDALTVARIVAALSGYGLHARHLRAFKSAADREVGLVEQVIAPLVKQRHQEARDRAEQIAAELAALSVQLHAALVKTGLGPVFPERPI